MNSKSAFRIVTLFSLCVLSVALLADPGFSIANIVPPVHEKYVLRGLDGDKKKEVSFVLDLLIEERETDGRVWKIRFSQLLADSKTDMDIVIRLSDLQPESYRSMRSFAEGNYKESFELGSISAGDLGSKEFFLANPQALLFILRTFPFNSDVKEMTVKTFGSRGGGFNFLVKNNGLKKLKLKTIGSCDAYEIELGMDIPFYSAFIPKTYYYFRNDPQKTLVKYKGSFAPGAKETEIELVEYTATATSQ